MLHNLRTAILENFGSQLECARAARIRACRLNRLVNGWACPTVEERERLSVALDAEATWLFSRVRVPPRAVSADRVEMPAAS